jgi:putative phosphoesterase
MKIGIITDIHANVIALEYILKYFKEIGVEYIVNTGDSIGMGPYPKETLDLLKTQKNCDNLAGNHEYYVVNNYIEGMDDEEIKHQLWVRGQLAEEQINWVKLFPQYITKNIENINITFLHCKYTNNNYESHIPFNNKIELENYFNDINSEIIFYGHTHVKQYYEGNKIYINPGPVGCNKNNMTYCAVISITDGNYGIELKEFEFSKEIIIKEFNERKIPGREEIIGIFY